MNNLLTREFHEAVGRVIPVEMNDDIALGQSLMDRIPSMEVDSEMNPIHIEEEEKVEEIDNLYSKLNFDLPNSKIGLIETILIGNKDYWGLYELYTDISPYNKLPKLSLYSFVRGLIGRPVSKNEYTKINSDIKSIKKSMRQLKDKCETMKLSRGNFTCDFV